MTNPTTTSPSLTPSRAKSVSDRIGEIKPYEIFIFFVLLVLLALCIVVSQIVVQDVDTGAYPAADSPESRL